MAAPAEVAAMRRAIALSAAGLGTTSPYSGKVTSLRHLAGELSAEITMLGEVIASLLAGDRGYQVIQQLPGIGPVLAAVIVAEIGELTRFKNQGQLCSWAGLTPRHRESDTKVSRGRVTKQGSRMLRWALIEAIQRAGADTVTGAVRTSSDRLCAGRSHAGLQQSGDADVGDQQSDRADQAERGQLRPEPAETASTPPRKPDRLPGMRPIPVRWRGPGVRHGSRPRPPHPPPVRPIAEHGSPSAKPHTAPQPATTSGKPRNHEDYEVRLEY
jgi:hypothetical protein